MTLIWQYSGEYLIWRHIVAWCIQNETLVRVCGNAFLMAFKEWLCVVHRPFSSRTYDGALWSWLRHQKGLTYMKEWLCTFVLADNGDTKISVIYVFSHMCWPCELWDYYSIGQASFIEPRDYLSQSVQSLEVDNIRRSHESRKHYAKRDRLTI